MNRRAESALYWLAMLIVRLVPRRRRSWIEAMTSEIAHIAPGRQAARFALGCALAALAMRLEDIVHRYGEPAVMVITVGIAILLGRSFSLTVGSVSAEVSASLVILALAHLLCAGLCLRCGPRVYAAAAGGLAAAAVTWCLAGTPPSGGPFLRAVASESALIWALLGIGAYGVACVQSEQAP